MTRTNFSPSEDTWSLPINYGMPNLEEYDSFTKKKKKKSSGVRLHHFSNGLSANRTSISPGSAAHAQHSVATIHEQSVHLFRVAQKAQVARVQACHGFFLPSQHRLQTPYLRPAEPGKFTKMDERTLNTTSVFYRCECSESVYMRLHYILIKASDNAPTVITSRGGGGLYFRTKKRSDVYGQLLQLLACLFVACGHH